jgi:alcohol dehydrogenase class IV
MRHQIDRRDRMQSGRIVFGKMEEVVYGQPAAQAIADIAQRTGATRVFLMASGTLERTTDEIDKVRRALGNRCAGTFSAMPPHTPRSAVIEATRQARAVKADLIVTIGGGSITDGAKAVQLCLANDITTPEGMDALRPVKGSDGVVGPPPHLKAPAIRQITVPTTLSAGEFSAIAGVTDERTKVKELLRHPGIMPLAVILDPAVTVHTPEWLWLSTGIRAVDHCVEGICSNEANAYGDAQALKGLSLLAHAMPRVKADPGDIAARLDCQLGSWMSMGPLTSGVPMGASHGIGYVLGAAFDVPHGHTSCIMLPAVMRWNKAVNAGRQALVSAAMGQSGGDAGDTLAAFIASLGMPRSLSAVGIGSEHFERIAEGAMGTPWVPRNPRPIDGPHHVREILEIAA